MPANNASHAFFSFPGLDRTAKLDFSNNQLTTLDWENWYPVLDQVTGVQVVDVAGKSWQLNKITQFSLFCISLKLLDAFKRKVHNTSPT